ncbi:MAG: hypothetical protein NC918_08505 [Candidatus Omnitrophica bacterium]|nr:hypothetical protein [Candidatus Omnitrophota bacterium]
MRIIFLFIVFLLAYKPEFLFATQDIKLCATNRENIVYDVYFNEVCVGKIKYRYIGKKIIYKSLTEILHIKTNINIAPFFNLKSDEYIYLDDKTYLPLKVDRKVIFFGKKEMITEIYNQKKGYVKIYTNGFFKKTKIFYPGKPIQNILALLYCFPKDLDLDKKSFFSFIFPTNRVDIKVDALKTLTKDGQTKNVYLIKDFLGKKFDLFLEKETKSVIYLRVNLAFGKVFLARRDY